MPYSNISINGYRHTSNKSIISQLSINLNYKFVIFAMDVIAFICLYFFACYRHLSIFRLHIIVPYFLRPSLVSVSLCHNLFRKYFIGHSFQMV